VDVFPVIPGFRIEKSLGGGRIADVYLGVQEDLDKKVVIKILHPELFLYNNFAERFPKEARKAKKFVHPNIANILDVGQWEEYHYIVLEYLPESLRNKINRQFGIEEPPAGGEDETGETGEKLESYKLLHILKQVAWALDYAHKEGMIHEDIRPENIRFREDGTPVLDFFISLVTGFKAALKKKGITMAPPHYGSPEQALKKPLDGKSDIYSLGVVLYETLIGKIPYDAEETIAIENQHIMEPVPQLPETLSPYQSLLDQMMAKNKEERVRSGVELIRLIDELGYKLPENRRKEQRKLEIPSNPQDALSEAKKKTGRKKEIGAGVRKKKEREDFFKTLLNPKILVPVVGVVVIIGVLLVLFMKSSPPPAVSKVPAGKDQTQQKKADVEKKKRPLTVKERREQREKDTQFQYKFRLAQRFFKKSQYQKAMDKLIEAEKYKQTAESKQLAEKLTVKLAEKKDDDTFKQALAARTLTAMEEYVKQYPSGRNIKEAGKELVQLRIEEKKRQAERRRILASSLKLRSQYKDLTAQEVKTMLAKYNFFDKYYNKTGNCKNHFEVKTVKEDKIVVDFATALVWHPSGSPEYMNLEKAKQWIVELNKKRYAGYTDWRLPTLEEVASLMENAESRYGLFVDAVFSREQVYIWTGDTFGKSKGWVIDFFGGDVNRVAPDYNVFVRPVRSYK